MTPGALLAVLCLDRDQEMMLHYRWMSQDDDWARMFYDYLKNISGAQQIFSAGHGGAQRLCMGFATMEEALAFKLKWL